MNLSLNWLKEHIDLDDISDEQIAEELTNVGLEVEGVEQYSTLKNELKGVVVGHVSSVSPHPDPEVKKLRLCSVDLGNGEPVQIVCGAPNVAAGQKVPVATVGTRLTFSDGKELKIKKGKIRGEVSMGMICAEDELGIGDSHEGIMVLDEGLEVGTPFVETLAVYEDTVLEIGLTPNRVDAACHKGTALDMAARLNKELKSASIAVVESTSSVGEIVIRIHDSEACPRYSGLVMRNVTIKDSPEWLQNKLKAIGLQPINNVVDITNYVMHDIGSPMHAFDLQKLNGPEINVRMAKKGEKITTLDGVERTLDGTELTIADAECPQAIAGVIGGLDSSITTETTDILLEAAYFNPSMVRRTAKNHQVSTDSSFRFERGADPENVLNAMSMAAHWVQELAGGSVDGKILDVYPKAIEPVSIEFSLDYLNSVAGFEIPAEKALFILERIGIICTEKGKGLYTLSIPTNKPDVTRPIDVVEEIMRIYGYEHAPLRTDIQSSIPSSRMLVARQFADKVTSTLSASGFFEVKTVPMDKNGTEDQVTILNPLSAELTHLRADQLTSGLKALAHNLNRQQKSVRFFEIGNDYAVKDGVYHETQNISLWAVGDQDMEDSWSNKNRAVDFFWIKGQVNKLLNAFGIDDTGAEPFHSEGIWEYGLKLSTDKGFMGLVGQLSVDHSGEHEVDVPVFAAKIDKEALLNLYHKNSKIRYREPGKFPRVVRDLSFVLDESVQYAEIEEAINASRAPKLIDIQCFDLYKGKPLEKGQVSYALRFIFEDKHKTLQDKQIDYAMNQITKALEGIGCQIRK